MRPHFAIIKMKDKDEISGLLAKLDIQENNLGIIHKYINYKMSLSLIMLKGY